ncbi:MAG TPA: ABC transporter substrate-binding protein [Methanomassiliicoccales archaeon]|nr:ABC transporter substrate-binding protein [Methanomassiliicoccales archaeon]
MASRKTTIIAVIVVVALVVSGSLVYLGMNNNKVKSTGTIAFIDSLGNNVTLNSTPLRVVSASPSTTELLYSMGVEEFLVGVTSYCDYPLNETGKAPMEKFTNIGGFYSPNFEKIASLVPDLVLIDPNVKKQKDLLPQMESVGIKYACLYPGKNISEIKSNLVYIGKIFDKESVADNIIKDMDAKLSSITAVTAGIQSKLKVMVMVSWSPSIYVTGGKTFIDDIIHAAGGINSFGNGTGYTAISKEAIVQADPDMILVCSSMIPGLTSQEVLDQIMNDVLLKNTQAVINNKVFVIQDDAEGCFLRSSTRVVQATQILADMLYPADFGETLPNIIGNDYVNYLPDSWNTGSLAVRAS